MVWGITKELGVPPSDLQVAGTAEGSMERLTSGRHAASVRDGCVEGR